MNGASAGIESIRTLAPVGPAAARFKPLVCEDLLGHRARQDGRDEHQAAGKRSVASSGSGRLRLIVTGGFTASQVGCPLCGDEFRKATDSWRPMSDREVTGLAAPKLTVRGEWGGDE